MSWLRGRMAIAVFAIVFVSVQVPVVARLVAGLQGAVASIHLQVAAECHRAANVALWGTAAACEHANVAASEAGAGLSFVLAVAGWCVLDFLALATFLAVRRRAGGASAAQPMTSRRPAGGASATTTRAPNSAARQEACDGCP